MIGEIRQRHELSGVEVLRFICAVFILIVHYHHFFFYEEFSPAASRQMRPGYPLDAILAPVYEHGGWAVNVFWVISGFIFYRRYSEPISAAGVKAYEFAIRRFSRLYPLHIVTLGLVALGQYAYSASHGEAFIFPSNSTNQFLSHIPLASNWFVPQHSFNGPIWSVSVEILIYLAFFCIVRWCGASLLIAIGCALFLGALYSLHTQDLLRVPVINPAVFACGAYFFAGGAVQRLSKHPLAFPVAVCACAGITVLLVFGLAAPNDKSIMVLALSSTTAFARAGAGVAGPLLQRLAFLGNATYSSYLLHFPLQIAVVLVVDALDYDRSLFFSPLALVAYLAIVIASSLAVYRWFERPAEDRIRVLLLPSYAAPVRA
jgi:peptidoglycan/LPS O-acetylase OafA/YrhL